MRVGDGQHPSCKGGHRGVVSVDNARDLPQAVRELARPGDMVVCLGAGNSTEWAHALPDLLAEPQRIERAGGKV